MLDGTSSARGVSLSWNTQEIVQGAQVSHGEFLAKSSNNLLKKSSSGGCEHYVIDIEKKMSTPRAILVSLLQAVNLIDWMKVWNRVN
jgi:hypothetical protein